jgi:hypothetical protein
MKQMFSSRGRRVAIMAAVLASVAAGAMTSAGWAHRAHVTGPAPSTAALNRAYAACIEGNGATYSPLAKSGGMYQVNIPAEANAKCAALDLAREAAGNGDAGVAGWLATIEAPASFWGCLGASGYHVPGGSGQGSDYASSAFVSTARSCAVSQGVALPVGP